MPHPGPWLTPTVHAWATRDPNDPVAPDFGAAFEFAGHSMRANWADLRSGAGFASSVSGPAELIKHSPGDYTILQSLWRVDLSHVVTFAPYSQYATLGEPFPPNTVDVEFEDPAGHFLASPPAAGISYRDPTGPLHGELDDWLLILCPPARPYSGWQTVANIQTRLDAGDLIGTVSYPYGDIEVNDLGPPYIFLTSYRPIGLLPTGTSPTALLDILVIPASFMQAADPWPATTFTWAQPFWLMPALEYIGPRYRFVFSSLPRLRQFPRDDGLGGAPRQGKRNGSTSVQGSTRQGWRGTYR